MVREDERPLAPALHHELGELFSRLRVELRAAIAGFRQAPSPELTAVVDRLQAAAGLTDIGAASLAAGRQARGSSEALAAAPGDHAAHGALSVREYQVLRMIGAGRTVSEIGAELGLSVKTVSTYRVRILEKLQLRTSAEIIHYAIANKLVP